MDVRPHPHINLATVTYLFEGAIDHRDSLGTNKVIAPGAVNLMTAGRGIVHSERTPQRGPRDRIVLLRDADLARLARRQGGDRPPPSSMSPENSLPLIDGDGVSARVLMGSLWGVTAPTTQHAATIYADVRLDAGASVPIDADADERAVLLVEGAAHLDGEPLEPVRLDDPRPGRADDADRDRAVAADAARRRGLRHAAPRVVELRQLVARPH